MISQEAWIQWMIDKENGATFSDNTDLDTAFVKKPHRPDHGDIQYPDFKAFFEKWAKRAQENQEDES